MKYKHDFLVGAVFFAGLILIGIFTLVVTSLPTLSGNQGKISIIFNKVSGLAKGHKVLASGMEVGQVKELKLRSDGTVKVDIDLTEKITLRKGYKVTVRDTSALGGKYIDLELGNPKDDVILTSAETALTPIKETPKLKGSAEPSLFDDPNLREIFVSVRRIVKDIELGKGTVGLLIKEREIYDNIKAASEDIKKITSQMRNKNGTIGKLLYDKKLYDEIEKIAINVRSITHKIDKGQGTLGKLINEDDAHISLKKALKNANKVMVNLADITDRVKKGEGTVGKLFMDDKVYNTLEGALVDARTMIKGINKTVTKLNKGKGTLGRLLNDEDMGKDLKETLANIKVVTERLKKGEGTVGKLLADDTLYKEVRRAIKTFSTFLEDTREQVPITTFSNILFKAF